MSGVIVADSGPIIHLSRIGLLDVLPTLYGRIIVPRQVFQEVVVAGTGLAGSVELSQATWADIAEHDPQDPLFRAFLQTLQIGESAALAIAVSRRADLLLADDNRARISAISLGLRVKGTLGLLVLAKQRGHLDVVAPYVESLRKSGVWISAAVIQRTLNEAGEAPTS